MTMITLITFGVIVVGAYCLFWRLTRALTDLAGKEAFRLMAAVPTAFLLILLAEAILKEAERYDARAYDGGARRVGQVPSLHAPDAATAAGAEKFHETK